MQFRHSITETAVEENQPLKGFHEAPFAHGSDMVDTGVELLKFYKS